MGHSAQDMCPGAPSDQPQTVAWTPGQRGGLWGTEFGWAFSRNTSRTAVSHSQVLLEMGGTRGLSCLLPWKAFPSQGALLPNSSLT